MRYGLTSEFQRLPRDQRPSLVSAPVVVVAPEGELLPVGTARSWCRATTADDALLADLIAEGIEEAEDYSNRVFLTRTLEVTLDGSPGQAITLTVGPVQTVVSVTCYDLDNAATVVDPSVYYVDAANGRIVLNSGQTWPTDLRPAASVVVRYTAGYGAAEAVPRRVLTWLKDYVAARYEHRGDTAERPAINYGPLDGIRKYDL